MNARLLTYEEYKSENRRPKYFGLKCFIQGCNKPAEYEGGDARCWFGVCEEHAGIRESYEEYVRHLEYKKAIRRMWMKER